MEYKLRGTKIKKSGQMERTYNNKEEKRQREVYIMESVKRNIMGGKRVEK